MISVSTTYDNLIANGGQYEWQIVNGANTYDKTNIMNGTITQTQFQEFSVGNVVAAELDLNLWNTPSGDTSSPLSVQFRATDGSSNSAWYTKGVFFIDTVETSPYSEVTHITAFDAMLKTEVVYMRTGTWTATNSYAVLTQIAGDIGVNIDANTNTLISGNPIAMTAAPTLGENGTTDREMLQYIGAMYGGNFVISSAGELRLVELSASPTNTANVGDAVVSFDANPVETVLRIRVWLDDNTYYAFPELPLQTHIPEDITTHTPEDITIRVTEQYLNEWEAIGGKCFDIDLPLYATYDIAEELYNKFYNVAFQPYTADGAYVDPKYEIGDGITIKDVTSIIANQTLHIDALAPSDLEIRGEEIVNSYYPYVAPIQREVSRLADQSRASLEVLNDRIIAEVNARTATDNSLQQSVDNNQAAITEVRSTLTQTAEQISATIVQQFARAEGYTDEEIASLQSQLEVYIRYYISGGTGVLELGDSNNRYKAKLTNQKFSFYDGDTEVAYISNNKLFISNGQITDNLQIGKYQWLTDSTGRMSLKWVG